MVYLPTHTKDSCDGAFLESRGGCCRLWNLAKLTTFLAIGLTSSISWSGNDDKLSDGNQVSAAEYEGYKARLKAKGELAPFPELKPIVRKLEGIIDSEEITKAISSNSALVHMREMVLTSLFHLDLEFNSTIKEAAYSIPFEAPFPYRPTTEAINEGLEFLELVDKVTDSSFSSRLYMDKKSSRSWFSLVDVLPSRNPPRKSQTVNMTALGPMGATEITPERRLIRDPVNEYAKYHARLKSEGENASFPEFKRTVDKLTAALTSTETNEFVRDDRALLLMRDKALQSLQHIASGGVAGKPYPYRPTIDSILNAVKFFDVVERTKYVESTNARAVEESWVHGPKKARMVEPLYHFDRYKYHYFSLPSDPDLVIFPTIESLEPHDLVRVRSVPIGFIGVETTTVFADRHYQTPIDFFYHDVNHVRRMTGYMNGVLEEAGAITDEAKLKVYKKMDGLIRYIERKTKIPPKPLNPRKIGIWKKEVVKRKIARVILYEILHESALTADPKSIINDLLRTPQTLQPFEYQHVLQSAIGDVETLRTHSGNLVSGARRLRAMKGQGPVYIQYFHDRALSLLSNVVNKLTHNFYDSVYAPNEDLVPVKYRTPENVVDAVELLFKILGVAPPSRKVLREWAYSRGGGPEKYDAYRGLDVLRAGRKSCLTSVLNAMSKARR